MSTNPEISEGSFPGRVSYEEAYKTPGLQPWNHIANKKGKKYSRIDWMREQ
ncbi:hypothetical protein Smp_148810 [Schistosoma mansoni]|uniref:hypothetical protein n=1 Tax=Schistosoma mansoni TaxID=6183 RepID=UPI0001A63C2D|nr:hypothetical protein Smp_148810 [Schistosoma mansoni]|eukprot:XP_018645682.1 hypothetical protein Smp_148810 [Schistosoma mansoni]